jgi:hypothetical protein
MPNIENPEVDSSWIDANDFSSKAFENSTTSSFPGFILLGTIRLLSPGDYDSDGDVDDADYEAWRDAFGMVGENLVGDGNRDSVVDAADYVIWRSYAHGGNNARGPVSSILPEPPGLTLLCGILITEWLFVLRCPVARHQLKCGCNNVASVDPPEIHGLRLLK